MLKSKYKVGDLVQIWVWDAVVVGLIIKVENCGPDLTLPRRFDDHFMYTIKTSKQNIIYFQSELSLVS